MWIGGSKMHAIIDGFDKAIVLAQKSLDVVLVVGVLTMLAVDLARPAVERRLRDVWPRSRHEYFHQ